MVTGAHYFHLDTDQDNILQMAVQKHEYFPGLFSVQSFDPSPKTIMPTLIKIMPYCFRFVFTLWQCAPGVTRIDPLC